MSELTRLNCLADAKLCDVRQQVSDHFQFADTEQLIEWAKSLMAGTPIISAAFEGDKTIRQLAALMLVQEVCRRHEVAELEDE